MRNNIKISFHQPEYIVDEANGVVICKLKFNTSAPSVLSYCSKVMFHENPVCATQVVKTVVFAKNGDKFDVNVGKKVALAKAENRAYAYVNNWFMTAHKEIVKAVRAMTDFKFKTKKVREHNIEYMKKF